MRKSGVVIALLFAFVLFSATFASAEGGISGWFLKKFVADDSKSEKYEVQQSPEIKAVTNEQIYAAKKKGLEKYISGRVEYNPKEGDDSGGGCVDECTPFGNLTCIDGNLSDCRDHDFDGCLEWGLNRTCTFGCSGTSCLPEDDDPPACVDECSPFGNLTCMEGNLSDCRDHDFDGCLEWGLNRTCTFGCSGTSCLDSPPTCTDECDFSGQTMCNGDYLKTCGNWDSDSCLEYTSGALCQNGCSSGACLPPMNDTNNSLPDLFPQNIYWVYNGSGINETDNSTEHSLTISWSALVEDEPLDEYHFITLSVYNSAANEWRDISISYFGPGQGELGGTRFTGFGTFKLRNYDSILRLEVDSSERIDESDENNNILEVDLTHTECSNSQCVLAEGLLDYECTSNIQCRIIEEPDQPFERDPFWARFLRVFRFDQGG